MQGNSEQENTLNQLLVEMDGTFEEAFSTFDVLFCFSSFDVLFCFSSYNVLFCFSSFSVLFCFFENT